MTIEEEKFITHLALYGSNIKTWPKAARILGQRLQHQPDCFHVLEKEKHFESILRECKQRVPSHDLVDRIVAKARESQKSLLLKKTSRRHQELLTAFNPAALAVTLLLGIALGFGSFATLPQQLEHISPSYFDEESAIP